MPVTISTVPGTCCRLDDRLQVLPAHAVFQRRLRRDPPVARLVEIGQFAPVVHDEQHVVVPQPPEVAACERARTARRVAHEHAPAAQPLDHHEMAVAAVVEQHDRRQAFLEELVDRQHEAVGLVPLRLQIAAYVEQRESLLADSRLVAVVVHVAEHLRLGDRLAVLVRQQRRDRRRTATEVTLLRHGGLEPRFLEAGHVDRVAAAVRHAQAERAGLRARACGQRKHAARDLQDAGPAPGHGVGGSTNCTFTAVPFWISTLDPLFWITVVMPAVFANARSEEHTSELQSLMRISYAVFCLKNKIFPDSTTPYNIIPHLYTHLLSY